MASLEIQLHVQRDGQSNSMPEDQMFIRRHTDF
jgi:hypothetical protein